MKWLPTVKTLDDEVKKLGTLRLKQHEPIPSCKLVRKIKHKRIDVGGVSTKFGLHQHRPWKILGEKEKK